MKCLPGGKAGGRAGQGGGGPGGQVPAPRGRRGGRGGRRAAPELRGTGKGQLGAAARADRGDRAPGPAAFGLGGGSGVVSQGGGSSEFLPKKRLSDSSAFLPGSAPRPWTPCPGSGKPESRDKRSKASGRLDAEGAWGRGAGRTGQRGFLGKAWRSDFRAHSSWRGVPRSQRTPPSLLEASAFASGKRGEGRKNRAPSPALGGREGPGLCPFFFRVWLRRRTTDAFIHLAEVEEGSVLCGALAGTWGWEGRPLL